MTQVETQDEAEDRDSTNPSIMRRVVKVVTAGEKKDPCFLRMFWTIRGGHRLFEQTVWRHIGGRRRRKRHTDTWAVGRFTEVMRGGVKAVPDSY